MYIVLMHPRPLNAMMRSIASSIAPLRHVLSARTASSSSSSSLCAINLHCSLSSSSSASRYHLARSSSLSSSSSSSSPLCVRYFSAPARAPHDHWNNVTPGISSLIGRNLHLQPGHPIDIIKKRIAYYFDSRADEIDRAAASSPSPSSSTPPSATAAAAATAVGNNRFTLIDSIPPSVSVVQNFDELLFPTEHVGRSQSDTFYTSRTSLLRTHTSAHQSSCIRSGLSNFLVVGDCYRRDEIDATHYPVFHQMEGVKLFAHDSARFNRAADGTELVVADLKSTLEGLIHFLFQRQMSIRWVEGNFPFTHASLEMEILFNGEWIEVLGCGVIQPAILDACADASISSSSSPSSSTPSSSSSSAPSPSSASSSACVVKHGQTAGWAFGLGLERFAMILFGIGDIRLFWSRDARFISQFAPAMNELAPSSGGGGAGADGATDGRKKLAHITFEPFSKYPACTKDIAFWIGDVAASASSDAAADASSPTPFHENDLCSLIREVAGDLVEHVVLHDTFVHKKKGTSLCYRISFRSLERNLTNAEIDVFMSKIQGEIKNRMNYTVR